MFIIKILSIILIKFDDDDMNPLGGEFKSSLNSLFMKNKMGDFLLGRAYICVKVVWLNENYVCIAFHTYLWKKSCTIYAPHIKWAAEPPTPSHLFIHLLLWHNGRRLWRAKFHDFFDHGTLKAPETLGGKKRIILSKTVNIEKRFWQYWPVLKDR